MLHACFEIKLKCQWWELWQHVLYSVFPLLVFTRRFSKCQVLCFVLKLFDFAFPLTVGSTPSRTRMVSALGSGALGILVPGAAPEALHGPCSETLQHLLRLSGLGTAWLYSQAPLCLPPHHDPDLCYPARPLGLKPAALGAEKSARDIWSWRGSPANHSLPWGRDPDKNPVTVMGGTCVVQNWKVLQKWSHFLEKVKQDWFLVWAPLLLPYVHISVWWKFCNSNSVIHRFVMAQEPHELVCEPLASAWQNYWDSAGCSPKAWTTNYLEFPLHPPISQLKIPVSAFLPAAGNEYKVLILIWECILHRGHTFFSPLL